VRTILVPAMAVIVGKANWWPSSLAANPKRTPAESVDDDSQLSLF
jgi:RND superfamily putative drug exporter